MKSIRSLSATFGFLLSMAASSAMASETVLVEKILSPEGPLYVDGNLYFVSAGASRLYKWDGKETSVVHEAAGCAHNGLAVTAEKTFLIACLDLKNAAIIETDLQGKELRRWDADSEGRRFDGGVNDFVVAKDGGVYATICGPFATPPAAVAGRVVYRAPGSDKWVHVASDFNYANGIGLSPDQKTLYVAETVGNSIKKFTVKDDGSLSDRQNFALLNVLVKNKAETWWVGPDGIKVDRKGNVYVAQWEGGRILKIAPDGKLLHVFDVAAGAGTMNLAFDDDEKNMFIAVATDLNDPEFKGDIVKIPNVE